MALVMAPLLGLYVLGVLMAQAVYRPRVVGLEAGSGDLETADGKLEDEQQGG
jgi:hypothetical protein